MNHLEAQSYIMPFIEGKVPDNKQEDFVMHMKNCKKCHEELEIYYTLLVGMKQLDNKSKLSTDFSKDLEAELKAMGHHVRKKKNFKVSAFSFVMAGTIIVIGLLYAGVLNKVFSFEQYTKELNQGEYYFSYMLHDNLIYDNSDRIYESDILRKGDSVTDFDRIKGYNRMEKEYDNIINIGEGLTDVKTTSD